MGVMSHLMNETPILRDGFGNIVELEDWSEAIARERAREQGLELTEDHMKVLRFLRLYYMDGGNQDSAAASLRMLEDRFSAEGGGRWLYQLFPGGPINQGMALAGLPRPGFASDRSFGTVT